jgi:hypothetical protein
MPVEPFSSATIRYHSSALTLGSEEEPESDRKQPLFLMGAIEGTGQEEVKLRSSCRRRALLPKKTAEFPPPSLPTQTKLILVRILPPLVHIIGASQLANRCTRNFESKVTNL